MLDITLKKLPDNQRTARLVLAFFKTQPHDHYQAWGYGEPTMKSVTSLLSRNAVFAILLNGTQVVGITGFTYKGRYFIQMYNGQFWVHYIIDKEYNGRGIATIALAKLLDIIRDETNIERVYAGIFSYNPASIKVVKKLGFVKREERAQTQVFEKRIEDITS